MFARVAGFAQRRRRLALTLWLAVLAAVWGAAALAGSDYRSDFSLPGTESQRAGDLLSEHGSDQGGDTVEIVLRGTHGLREAGTERRVEGMLKKAARVPKVAHVVSPYEEKSAISRDGRTGYATVVLTVPAAEMTKGDTEPLYDIAREIHGGGLQVELGGEAARTLSEESGGTAEGAGILAALVILVLMFGTVVAAGLPIVTAVFAVGSTVGVIVLLSHVFTLADFTPYVMMLVGLGVGIDYALLVLARYRGELVRGEAPERAATTALDAAGRTVFFAACTVVLALLGLVALGLGSLQGMALAVALTVLATMVAALTLLPALLGVFGPRLARHFTRREARRSDRRKAPRGTGWRRFADGVQRRPLPVLLVAVVALGALAVPALELRLGFADAGNDSAGTTSREAYDLLSEGFGPGFNGPLVVVADGGEGGARQAGAEAARVLGDTPGIAAAAPPVPTEDGAVATVVAFPASSPQDERTSDLVARLRGTVLPELAERTGADYLVGGSTAAAEDYAGKVADRMPVFFAIVVGLSLVLLAGVFRSLLIPLKAALLNMLSIGSALGAMKLVFQDGRFGMEAGPVEPWMPVMVFAIVFGLSMDYEIFLVSRIREEWVRTRDPVAAVREGLAHTGSVIVAAGAIMIVVFGAFMLSDDRVLQQLGFGMAVAICVDALLVRCVVVPAALRLMGRRAWWLPEPLERVLPRVELERH
ncbi:MMPL family transporter [Streptomyces sp. SB3404]|uniref:MMPL family transporter n=1 Tax=Streptomyces boncukensis TaxID=2711219 RepID=A0A6G4X423_9ACTN|nr:MMPL family transporter [Streptomyces boncukensis]